MKKNQTNQSNKKYENLSSITTFDWLEENKSSNKEVETLVIDDTFLSWLDIDDSTLELLDTTTQKRVKKKRFILILLVLSLIIVTIFGVVRQIYSYNQTILAYEQGNKPVLQWLKAFVDADFVICDELSRPSEEKLTTTQNEYYDKLLEKVVDSITNVEIQKIVDNKDKICYDIVITYKTYKVSSNIKGYESKYKEIEKSYLDNKITDEEVREKIEELYVNTYESGFELSDKTESKDFTIYSDNKGVGNIDELVEEMIEGTNVLNVSDKIKETLDKVRKDY